MCIEGYFVMYIYSTGHLYCHGERDGSGGMSSQQCQQTRFASMSL